MYIGRAPISGQFEKQQLTADSSTTTFALDWNVGSTSAILVSVGGVIQEPETAYNLTGGGASITFTAAPTNGDRVYVHFLGQSITQRLTDLNGVELILDADADTSITADTDDTIDIKISDADDFQFTANTFTSLSGSTIKTNTIAETTSTSGVTIDGLLIKDSKIDTANSVDSDAYVDGSIDLVHLSANSVDSTQYVDGSIDTAHYAAGSVDTTALGADAVTAAKIADDVINSEHYAAASIDNEHLADDAVDSDELAAGSVDLAHMSANSIDSTQYVDGSIDLAHMSVNSIDSDQYVDGSIDLAHMSVNSIDSDQYVDGSIDTAHMADNQITLAKMAGLARGKIIYGDSSGDPAALTIGGDGTALMSDGTDVAWGVAGTSWQAVVTGATTMVAGRGYFVNTTSSAFTMTLPASPSIGDAVKIIDYAGTFDSNTCTIGRNSQKIAGASADMTVTTERAGLTLVFTDSTQGWLLAEV